MEVSKRLEIIKGGEAAGRAEEIFEGADEQARDAETMVQSMDEVAKVSLVNASAVEEVAELARQEQGTVAEMTGAAGCLAELSGDLAEMVGRFETGAPTEER